VGGRAGVNVEPDPHNPSVVALGPIFPVVAVLRPKNTTVIVGFLVGFFVGFLVG
jgi:hypothetical protein